MSLLIQYSSTRTISIS